MTKTQRFEMRLPPQLIYRIDIWRKKQSEPMSRACAIRKMVDKYLIDDANRELIGSTGISYVYKAPRQTTTVVDLSPGPLRGGEGVEISE